VPLSTHAIDGVPAPLTAPEPRVSAELLEHALHANTALMNDLLGLVKDLVESHHDLVVVVDGLTEELASVSPTALNHPPADASTVAEAEASLRQATALARRAAAILARPQAPTPERLSARRLPGA
jgi:hypothetical protein